MCLVWVSEQSANSALREINSPVFILEIEIVPYAVRAQYITFTLEALISLEFQHLNKDIQYI
jgi:hypothetical protein